MTAYIVTFERRQPGAPRKHSVPPVIATDKRSAVRTAWDSFISPAYWRPEAVSWDGGECEVTAICDACDQAIFEGEDCANSEDSGYTCGECLQAVRRGNEE